jgi:hypothetical protein
MPQSERPDEQMACAVVVRETGHSLAFADFTGGVDYATADGTVVLEVTRFTNHLQRRDMAVATQFDSVTPLGTGHDWWVVFDGHPRYQDLASRLYQALNTLETHGLLRWEAGAMLWWAGDVPTLRDAVTALVAENVSQAQAEVPRQQPSRLFSSSSGGWVYSGPDAALELLDGYVRADGKHLKKLGATGATERHLWEWTDAATTGNFRRMYEDDRLPGRPPVLPAEVTHLWVADEEHRAGIRWDGQAWQRFGIDG